MEVKRVTCECYIDVADMMLDDVFCGDNEDADVIADYEIVEDIFRAIMAQAFDYELHVGTVEIDGLDFDKKDNPYMLSITDNGMIWVEEARNKDGIMKISSSDIAYVQPKYLDEFKEKYECENGEIFVIECEEEEESCGEACEERHVLKDEEGRTYGMDYHYCDGVNKYTVTYISSNPVDIEELGKRINKMIKEMER